MAKKTSELPGAQVGSEADLYAVVQSAQSRKQTRTQMRAAMVSAWQAFIGTFLSAADTAAARSAIGAAGSGSNTDITSLGGLTMPLPVASGGTGSATASGARSNLGVINVTPGFIDGLLLVWNSANSVSVSTGAAYIPGLSATLSVDATITKASLVLSAATWYHAYLYSNAGSADVEISTTAPSAKYFGTGRTKTGDMSRRYLGSFKTLAADTIIRFAHSGGKMSYLADSATAPLALLALATATTATSVACSPVVPVTGTYASIQFITTATGSAAMYAGNPDGGTIATSLSQVSLAASNASCVDLHLSSTQTFAYLFSSSPGAGGLYARVYGYIFER